MPPERGVVIGRTGENMVASASTGLAPTKSGLGCCWARGELLLRTGAATAGGSCCLDHLGSLPGAGTDVVQDTLLYLPQVALMARYIPCVWWV